MNAQVLKVGREVSLLDLVERRMEATVMSDVPVASDLSINIFSAGGKRIRPTLVILSALASGGHLEDERIIDVAATVELFHTASLVHDDVVDETRERRGAATASAQWGNKLSVLGGDFLLSKAFLLSAGVGNPEVLDTLSSTAVRMTESEMLQAVSEGSVASWESNYWRIIRGKTAWFMSACCVCGAILAEAEAGVRQALAGYGDQVGLAFQITDDLLDIVGDPVRVGKDIGTDLMHGKFTLPVLLALQKLDGEPKRELLALLNQGYLTRDEARSVADVVVECGAAEMARLAAVGYVEKACEHLRDIAASEHRTALENLATSITTREV